MWLLDTHLLLWAAYDAARLSRSATRLLQKRDARLVFSLASIWEVAIKASLQRSDFSAKPAELHHALLEEGLEELPILPAHIAHVATLPWLHRDPFDRMLVAQAAVEGLTLLSADATLKRYGRFVRTA
jgi:PIN domain nuclease of toxin-antitoxin system